MIKKITLFAFTILMFKHVSAQNQFKNPVKFKLKNDLSVIVAQNIGSGKIYSRLTVENEVKDEEKVVAKVFEDYLALKAKAFNTRQGQDVRMISNVTMAPNEVNTATGIFNFEQALGFVSLHLFDSNLAQQTFEQKEKVYTGQKSELQHLKLADFENYLSEHLKAQDIHLTIAGDISPAEAKLIVNRVFGDLTSKITVSAE